MASEPEVALIRALAEDLALEILASYKPKDFADADFTSLGESTACLADKGETLGPAFQKLVEKVQKAARTSRLWRDVCFRANSGPTGKLVGVWLCEGFRMPAGARRF
jgi:hypothetical protein